MKNINKKILFLMVLIMVVTLNITTVFAEKIEMGECEYSDEYLNWLENEQDNPYAIKPKMCKESEQSILFREVTMESLGEGMPTAYISPYISPVRNQGNTNTCWAFSTASTIEAFENKKANKTTDKGTVYSPLHMEYYATKYFNKDLNAGGNYHKAASYLMINGGPILETSLPFTETLVVPDVLEGTQSLDVNKMVVTSELGTCTDANKNAIKDKIMNYGSISTSMYYENGYFNSSNIYEYIGENSTNHAVQIVGWDDLKGAWIVKNSYGLKENNENYQVITVPNAGGTTSSTDSTGYFYLSYTDKFACNSIVTVEETDNKGTDYTITYDDLQSDTIITFKTNNQPYTGIIRTVYIVDNLNKTTDLEEITIPLQDKTNVKVFTATRDENSEETDFVVGDKIGEYESGDYPEYKTIALTKQQYKANEEIILYVEFKSLNSEPTQVPETHLQINVEGKSYIYYNGEYQDTMATDNVVLSMAVGLNDQREFTEANETRYVKANEPIVLKYDLTNKNINSDTITNFNISKRVELGSTEFDTDDFEVDYSIANSILTVTLTPKSGRTIVGTYDIVITIDDKVLINSLTINDYVEATGITVTNSEVNKVLIESPEGNNKYSQTATITPENATDQNIVWSIVETDHDGFEINSSTGEVTYTKAGTVTIKAAQTENEVTYILTVAENAVTLTPDTDNMNTSNKPEVVKDGKQPLFEGTEGKVSIPMTVEGANDVSFKIGETTLTYTKTADVYEINIPDTLEKGIYNITVTAVNKDDDYVYTTKTANIPITILDSLNTSISISQFNTIGTDKDTTKLYENIGGKIQFKITAEDYGKIEYLITDKDDNEMAGATIAIAATANEIAIPKVTDEHGYEAGEYCLTLITNEVATQPSCFTVQDEYKPVTSIDFKSNDETITNVTVDKDNKFALNLEYNEDATIKNADYTIEKKTATDTYEATADVIISDNELVFKAVGEYKITAKAKYEDVTGVLNIKTVDTYVTLEELTIVGNHEIDTSKIFNRTDNTGGGTVQTHITAPTGDNYSLDVKIQKELETDQNGNVTLSDPLTLEVQDGKYVIPSNTEIGKYCVVAKSTYKEGETAYSETIDKSQCFTIEPLVLIMKISFENETQTELTTEVVKGDTKDINVVITAEDGEVTYPELKWELSSNSENIIKLIGDNNTSKQYTAIAKGTDTINISADRNYTYYEYAEKIPSTYTCPEGYAATGDITVDTTCTKEVNSIIDTETYTCPDEYTSNTTPTGPASICENSSLEPSTQPVIVTTTYKCPADSIFDGDVLVDTKCISSKPSIVDTFTCPEGYTANGEECRVAKNINSLKLTVKVVEAETKITAQVNGNNDKNTSVIYTGTLGNITGKVDYSDINETDDLVIKNKETNEVVTTGFTIVTKVCEDGYTLTGTKCTKSLDMPVLYDTDTLIANGYTCTNGTCEKVLTASKVDYECPADYTDNGTDCVKTDTQTVDPTYDNTCTGGTADDETHKCNYEAEPTGYTDANGNTFKVEIDDSVETGTYYIEASGRYKYNGQTLTESTDTFEFNVEEYIALTALDYSKDTINIKKGKTYEVIPSYTPQNTSVKDVTYTTGNASIATVDNKGIVTAVSEGETTITITSVPYPSISKEITVKVVDPTTTVTIDTNLDTIYSYNGGVISGEFTYNNQVKPESISVNLLDEEGNVLTGKYNSRVTLSRDDKQTMDRIKNVCETGYTYDSNSEKCIIEAASPTDEDLTESECNAESDTAYADDKCTKTVGTRTEYTCRTGFELVDELRSKICLNGPSSETPTETKVCDEGYTKSGDETTCSKVLTKKVCATGTLNDDETKCIEDEKEPEYPETPEGYEVDENDETKFIEIEGQLNGKGTYEITIDNTFADGTYKVQVEGQYTEDEEVITVDEVEFDIEESTVTITNAIDKLILDEEVTLTVTSIPNANYTFESTNSNVLTVDADGKVKAVGAGTAKIVVTSVLSNNIKDEIEITVVNPIKITGMAITSSEGGVKTEFTQGESATLQATIVAEAETTDLKAYLVPTEGTAVEIPYSSNINYDIKDLNVGTYKLRITGKYDNKDIVREFQVTFTIVEPVTDITIEDVIEGSKYDSDDEYIYGVTSSINSNTNKDFTCVASKCLGEQSGNTYKALKTTFDDFKQNIATVDNDKIEFHKKDGAIASGTDTVTTDSYIVINPGTQAEKKYTIVISGDCNSDGNINLQDYVRIYNYVKAVTLNDSSYTNRMTTDAQLKAADANGDGKITLQDYVRIYNSVKSVL